MSTQPATHLTSTYSSTRIVSDTAFPVAVILTPITAMIIGGLHIDGGMGRLGNSITVTVQVPSHLFTLIADSALDIRTLRLCTDDILEAVFTSVKENVVKGTKTNIFVAAFTTCHARLKLYKSLDTLQKQVLYYDTDSVVYKRRPGQPVVDVATKSSHPYGYERNGDEIDLLLDL